MTAIEQNVRWVEEIRAKWEEARTKVVSSGGIDVLKQLATRMSKRDPSVILEENTPGSTTPDYGVKLRFGYRTKNTSTGLSESRGIGLVATYDGDVVVELTDQGKWLTLQSKFPNRKKHSWSQNLRFAAKEAGYSFDTREYPKYTQLTNKVPF